MIRTRTLAIIAAGCALLCAGPAVAADYGEEWYIARAYQICVNSGLSKHSRPMVTLKTDPHKECDIIDKRWGEIQYTEKSGSAMETIRNDNMEFVRDVAARQK